MHRELVDIVCCPVHKTGLKLVGKKEDESGDVQEGVLRCKECGFDYPIEDGIPNLLPPEYHQPQNAPAKGSGASEGPRAAKGSGAASGEGAGGEEE